MISGGRLFTWRVIITSLAFVDVVSRTNRKITNSAGPAVPSTAV